MTSLVLGVGLADGDDGGHTRRTEPLSFSLVPMQVRDYR